ncbi:MAG: leucine-rich repeat protein [Salinivirgaceae bacterium]|nr:leucine-rich repeat protein [Salinivirgaceae bacterium]
MKTYIYNVGEEPFDKWMNGHTDCEKLILKGCILAKEDTDDLEYYNKIISGIRLKQIDVKDLSINILPDDEYDNEIYDFYENEKDGPSSWTWWNGEHEILQHLVVNREYGTCFVICDNMILTEDKKVVVFHSNSKNVVIPDAVEIIGKYAFYGAYIDKLIIPESVKLIDVAAFYESGISEIQIPSSLKRIAAFAFYYAEESIEIPEGVEIIEDFAFANIKQIKLPSTLKFLSKYFFQDEDDDCKIPRVDVAVGNPYIYSENGALYSKDTKPYLDGVYVIPTPPQLLIWPEPEDFSHEYTVEELLADYPPYNIKPINSDNTLFWVYEWQKGYNIIDRYKNKYFNQAIVGEIRFIKDKAVLVKNNIYSSDLKELLFSSDVEIYDFDAEGRVYLQTDYEKDEIDPYECTYVPYDTKQWCVDYQGNELLKQKYDKLGVFSKEGIAPAKMNKKWGMINLNEDIIIPFEYSGLENFDAKGMALAQKGKKYGYIDRNNNVIIPFLYWCIYRKFNNKDECFALFDSHSKIGCFIDRHNNILGTSYKYGRTLSAIYEKKFHLFKKGSRYGYCRQFSEDFSGCIYLDIKVVNKTTLMVTENGINYNKIEY